MIAGSKKGTVKNTGNKCDPKKVEKLKSLHSSTQRLSSVIKSKLDTCSDNDAKAGVNNAGGKPHLYKNTRKPLLIGIFAILLVGGIAALLLFSGQFVGKAINLPAGDAGIVVSENSVLPGSSFTATLGANPGRGVPGFDVALRYQVGLVYKGITYFNNAGEELEGFLIEERIEGNKVHIRGFHPELQASPSQFDIARIEFSIHPNARIGSQLALDVDEAVMDTANNPIVRKGSATITVGCAAGQELIDGQCQGVCIPQTCAEMGKNCGTVDDGCGGMLECGTCAGNEQCGPANVCIAVGCANGAITPPGCGDCPQGKSLIDNFCTDDRDGDLVADTSDVCPGHDDRLDADGDGIPDGCDNCQRAANADQTDSDGDGIGDVCANCVPTADSENRCSDGVDNDCNGLIDCADPLCAEEQGADTPEGEPQFCCQADDHCGFATGWYCNDVFACSCNPNDDSADCDEDNVLNGVDNCPAEFNRNQADSDGNGVGDACEVAPAGAGVDNANDADNDGIADAEDICPGHDDNIDLDGDGTPDGCDNDRDGDGITNTDDCGADDPNIAGKTTYVPDYDDDGYGMGIPAQLCNPQGAYTALVAGDCDDVRGEDEQICINARDAGSLDCSNAAHALCAECRNPGVDEICGDGVDNNCDRAIDEVGCVQPVVQVKLGDVNGDTFIDILDINLIVDHIAEVQALEGNQLTAANTDCDSEGIADIFDINIIVAAIANEVTELSCPE